MRTREAIWLLIAAVIAFASPGSVVAQTAPVITSISAPRQVVNIGQTLGLTSFVTRATPPTYQWKRNGLPIPGATSSVHAFSNTTPLKDSGWYQLVVINASGSTSSAVMFVNVAVNVPQIVAWGDNQRGRTSRPRLRRRVAHPARTRGPAL